MKIYVAATFTRYLEARELIDALRAAGHDITFDWTRTEVFGPDGHPLPDTGDGYDLPREVQARHAQDDLYAVAAADLVLVLAQQASCGWPVEVGVALTLERARVWLIAPFKDTVFWALPQVEVFPDLTEPLARLGAEMPLSDLARACDGRDGCPVCGGTGVRCCEFGADRRVA